MKAVRKVGEAKKHESKYQLCIPSLTRAHDYHSQARVHRIVFHDLVPLYFTHAHDQGLFLWACPNYNLLQVG
jgi:hypothetical protein